ncbi:hypothetical protein H8959_004379 [Pygathrix nigripes]
MLLRQLGHSPITCEANVDHSGSIDKSGVLQIDFSRNPGAHSMKSHPEPLLPSDRTGMTWSDMILGYVGEERFRQASGIFEASAISQNWLSHADIGWPQALTVAAKELVTVVTAFPNKELSIRDVGIDDPNFSSLHISFPREAELLQGRSRLSTTLLARTYGFRVETLQVTHVSACSAADTPRRALLTSNHLVRTLPPANERIRTPFSTSRRAATAPSTPGCPVTAPGCPALLRPITTACSRSESRATDVTSTRPVRSSQPARELRSSGFSWSFLPAQWPQSPRSRGRGITGSPTCLCWLSVSVGSRAPTRARR